jgi:pyruvate dehydrogenase E2 component (dihydrolipoamide acetyltransferase)
MSTMEVTVPDIGDFTDVPIVSVMVKPGDKVAEEDPLIELESDKATMEVPSPKAGEVKEIKVSEGDKVSEGSLILLLEVEGAGDGAGDGGGDGAAAADRGRSEDKGDTASGGGQTEPEKTLVDASAEQRGSPPDGKGPEGSSYSGKRETEAARFGIHASPSVRAFARQMGIDLKDVEGTGRKNRILREDVVAYLKKRETPAAAPAAQGGMGIPPIPKVDFSKFGPVEDVEMPRVKKLSGPALHRSWLNVPHVTHNEEADITEIDRYRKELDTAAKAEGYRVTLLSFLIKASVSALRQHWEVNSSIHPDGDKLIRKSYYNIGFAADTPQGLVVPVIKDADKKGLVEISKELGTLSGDARAGKLKSQDMQGATFTISSLGGIGGVSFTPIVNAPEVAILGVTRSRMAPVWNGSEFEPRNMLPLSLSYDHRAIDGALAARFCATLRHLLGDVRRLLL